VVTRKAPRIVSRTAGNVVNRPGLVEAGFCHRQGFRWRGCAVGIGFGWGMSPMASNRRRLLYQSTHSKVAGSTPSRPRQGPLRLISSVLNKPMIDSVIALS
jgi:hypothetical protein